LRPTRNTSIRHPQNLIYRYLLRAREIRYPKQARCTGLAYIKLPYIGHVYLAAIMDAYSGKALSWRASNGKDSRFCEEALKEALAAHGVPAIFNTDQGSQFTSNTFTQILQDHHVRISKGGRGRWAGKVHIERLWRTVKHEEIHAPDECDAPFQTQATGA
jgi:putative transposase